MPEQEPKMRSIVSLVYVLLGFTWSATSPINAFAQAQFLDLYFVANTRPPDDFLALRSEPSSRYGERLEKMPNGTRLLVIQRREDGWWNVKNVNTGNVGWAFRGTDQRPWIDCCIRQIQQPPAQLAGMPTQRPPPRQPPIEPQPIISASPAPVSAPDPPSSSPPRSSGSPTAFPPPQSNQPIDPLVRFDGGWVPTAPPGPQVFFNKAALGTRVVSLPTLGQAVIRVSNGESASNFQISGLGFNCFYTVVFLKGNRMVWDLKSGDSACPSSNTYEQVE